ncbi:hypothetical protein [Amycolatopsis sp. FDAARGOS 1241]|nr:hypothetical protein [Amycolatopsis sp. FDAARGOS 1241]QRP45169.1 hypothetical protein I6J71_39325 [Amycolatopsis sp. FDAARGOS 1241]
MTVRVTESTPATRSRSPWWARLRAPKHREVGRPDTGGAGKTSQQLRG